MAYSQRLHETLPSEEGIDWESAYDLVPDDDDEDLDSEADEEEE